MESIQIKTISTIEAVVSILEEDIYSLHFPGGEKITEKDLTTRYGVGRGTVREAIASLLASGLLVKIANKGIYVKKISADEIQEIFRLRYLVEAEAIRQIISLGVIPKELYEIINQTKDQPDDWELNIASDIRFHAILVSSVGSPRLERLYETIFSEVKLCLYQSKGIVPNRPDNIDEHIAILHAIENDDLQGALDTLSKHFSTAVERFVSGYQLNENE